MRPFISMERKHIDDLLNPSLGATAMAIDTNLVDDLQSLARESVSGMTKAQAPTLVSNYSYFCLDPKKQSLWTEFSAQIASQLNHEIGSYIDLPERIIFDDLYLTKYEESEMGVGPHRDVNCKNFVVVLVLEGNPSFFICKDKDLSGSVIFPAQAGDLMIMRAKTFLDLPAPLHYVGQIHGGPMLQFGMRQYISKPTH